MTTMATDPGPRRWALVPAAGSGSRAGAGLPKQYRMLAGQPVLQRTLQALQASGVLDGVAVVLAPDDRGGWQPPPGVHAWRVGGPERAASVLAGLRQWQAHGACEDDWVLVHDAARCLVHPGDVRRLVEACADDPVGGLLALPLADTLKDADDAGRVRATLDRQGKWLAQTPQMFRFGLLLRALQACEQEGFAGITDEASAVERLGLAPRLVPGHPGNVKLTYPEDFAMAEVWLRGQAAGALRVGEGWDVHALVPGRRLVLGGVTIPFDKGLLGHSDADALLHAVTDAVLGAAGLGDIGTWFADTDPRWYGADSTALLAEAMRQVRTRGWQPLNVDATIVAQAPRLGPYRGEMQANVAHCLGLPVEAVNVKAKTAERLGPVGQGLSIEARAVVLLQRG